MGDAPEKIWAFYAPEIADDNRGCSIVAGDGPMYGAQPYIRADLHDARICEMEATTESRAQIIARNRCVVSEAEAAARIRILEAALRVMGVNPDTLTGET